jgi:hypothetical protein
VIDEAAFRTPWEDAEPMISIADIEELLSKAQGLPDGPIKIALCEEAVRGADLVGHMDWQFQTRHELVDACFMGGDPERLLVALSWSLAKCDQLGGCFDESSLLWGCKFALSYICAFPQISRLQIESLHEEVSARFRKYGASMRTPYIYRMLNELVMGSPDRAAEYRPLWLKSPRDDFSESPDWEVYFDAFYHHERGNIDRALEIGLPMIDGRAPSADVSFWMVDLLLSELLKRGEKKLAVAAHVQASRRSAKNPKFIDHMGVHLAFAALTGNFARAVRLLTKHLPVALQSPVPSAQFTFFLNAWSAAACLDAHATKPVRLRLPVEFPLWREDGKYEWTALAAWFESQAHELEARFNARNGNSYYTTLVAREVALRSFATNWPIGRSGTDENGAEKAAGGE